MVLLLSVRLKVCIEESSIGIEMGKSRSGSSMFWFVSCDVIVVNSVLGVVSLKLVSVYRFVSLKSVVGFGLML